MVDPDRLVLLEQWRDAEALAVHAKVNETRPPLPPGLRQDGTVREDYVYNRNR